MSEPGSPAAPNQRAALPRVMGLWDVLLFNIATVLGPRWIAAAAHNGASSISLWVLAAVFFFVPTALVITELSSRAKASLGPAESRIHIYDTPLQVLAGFLAVGFILTMLVRPLRERHPR